MKTAKYINAYRQHEHSIILHEAAARALMKQADIGDKLPNPSILQSEYNRIMEKKKVLRA